MEAKPMKRVKIAFEGKIRKFEVPEEQCHLHVKKLIERTTANRGFIPILQYMDEDGDWISIGTDADLALCLQTAAMPKIYIFHPTDMVSQRKEKVKEVEDNSSEWVVYRADTESPEILPAPAPRPAPAAEGIDNDVFAQMQKAASVLMGNAPAKHEREPAPAPMVEDEKEEKRMDHDTNARGLLPVDWNTLVEDLLTHQRALTSLVSEIFTAVQNGSDLKSAVVEGLKKEPFRSHPFVKNGMGDITKMLEKVNHMSGFILQAGKGGLELAVPLLLRGFAKNKMGGSNIVDMAPAFLAAFPKMGQWLQGGVPNGQDATFDMGKVMRHMMTMNQAFMNASGPVPRGPRGGEVDSVVGEPAEDPEVAAAAKDGIVMHKGITCDICNEKPIIGIRFKCMVCPDFDMCEQCKEKGIHPVEHPLIAMNTPAPREGFSIRGGHYKGASEMIRGPWGKCGPNKRRAFKKMCKRFCKGSEAAGQPAPAGEEEKEGCPRGEAPEEWGAGPHGHRGPRGRRHGHGRGRWRHRHHPFGQNNPWMPVQQHAMQPQTEVQQAPNPYMTAGGPYGSDSSSSSSSSSDSEDVEMTPHGGHTRRGKGHHHRHSGKKAKKHIKKLVKRQKKIAHKVNKLMHRQSKINRKLAKLKNKESSIIEEIDRRNRAMRAAAEHQRQQGLGAPTNPPGHDPNPNQRPKRPQGAQYPMFPFGAFHHPPPHHPPHHPHPHPMPPYQAPAPPSAPAPPVVQQNDGSYTNQLALLMEMGFDDVATCTRLLKETKGDIKSVVMMLSLQSAKANGFGMNSKLE